MLASTIVRLPACRPRQRGRQLIDDNAVCTGLSCRYARPAAMAMCLLGPMSERGSDLRLTLLGWIGRTPGSALAGVTLKFHGLTNSGPPFTSISYQSMKKLVFLFI